jgi:predicted sugar kinase
MPQVAPDLSFADMGRKWGGMGMTTPFSDINVESEVSDAKKESDGDPGAIRTRDPQLRRSTREILDSITNSASYNTFQICLVPAGDRLSRLEGGGLCGL